jgi:hypothetical protein
MIQGILGLGLEFLKSRRDRCGCFRAGLNGFEKSRGGATRHEFGIANQARHGTTVVMNTNDFAHFDFREKVFETGCNLRGRRVNHIGSVIRFRNGIKTRFAIP